MARNTGELPSQCGELGRPYALLPWWPHSLMEKPSALFQRCLRSQAWERFTEAQATMMGHSGNALGSGSTGLGDSWGQQGLDSSLCFV